MIPRLHPENWTPRFYVITGLILLAVNLFGPKGFVRWVLVNQEVARLAQQKSELTTRIEGLNSELDHLKSSKIAKERAVRQELGYLKPDEISVELPEEPTGL